MKEIRMDDCLLMFSLEKKGFLISANHNTFKMHHTKWYTFDYKKIEELEDPDPDPETQDDPSSAQNEPAVISDCFTVETNLNRPLPESTSKITSENKTYVAEVIHCNNEKIITNFRPSMLYHRELMGERIEEGFG